MNAKDGDDQSPLWYAENKGYTEIVELLRKYEAKKKAEGTSSTTNTPQQETPKEDKSPSQNTPQQNKPSDPNAAGTQKSQGWYSGDLYEQGVVKPVLSLSKGRSRDVFARIPTIDSVRDVGLIFLLHLPC